MAIDYEKYINSTGTHYISNSGGDERGKITGGAAGDQTGGEWKLKAWYNRPWSCVLRHPNPEVRRLIAELAIEAALNDNIGYDQAQRATFWAQLKVSGYRPANIKTKCESDCSAGANSIVKAVGYLLGIQELKDVSSANSSRNTKSGLQKAGFAVLTDSKYRTSGKYLLPGDILLYINHHVATNITRGAKAEGEVAPGGNTPAPTPLKLGDRILKNGMIGDDVKELQKMLIEQGYSCGSCGVDGEFGPDTEAAVRKFQSANNCEVDGEVGPETLSALQKSLGTILVTGGSVNIRSGPNTTFNPPLGIVHKGDRLPFQGISENGWFKTKFNKKDGWISPKYSKRAL